MEGHQAEKSSDLGPGAEEHRAGELVLFAISSVALNSSFSVLISTFVNAFTTI